MPVDFTLTVGDFLLSVLLFLFVNHAKNMKDLMLEQARHGVKIEGVESEIVLLKKAGSKCRAQIINRG